MSRPAWLITMNRFSLHRGIKIDNYINPAYPVDFDRLRRCGFTSLTVYPSTATADCYKLTHIAGEQVFVGVWFLDLERAIGFRYGQILANAVSRALDHWCPTHG